MIITKYLNEILEYGIPLFRCDSKRGDSQLEKANLIRAMTPWARVATGNALPDKWLNDTTFAFSFYEEGGV